MLFWVSYCWCLIRLQLHVILSLVSPDFLSVFNDYLSDRHHGALLHLKQGNCSYWRNTTLLQLCCWVLQLKYLSARDHLVAFLMIKRQPSGLFFFFLPIWGVRMVIVQVRVVWGRYGKSTCSLKISASFVGVLWRLSLYEPQASMQYAVLQCTAAWCIMGRSSVSALQLRPFTLNPAKGLNSGISPICRKQFSRNYCVFND